MLSRLKISHIRHTGRFLPHEHTSYGSLVFVTLLCGVILSAVTLSAFAATPYSGPEQGSVGLSGTVPTAPPKVAAVIITPKSGQHFGVTPISVTGTCPKDTIVELFKNDIFAGAGLCQSDQTFNIEIDLLIGSNTLIARVYDALDQAGPDSNSVTVFYDAVPPQALPLDGTNINNLQLLLRSSPVYRGAFPGQDFKFPLEIIGGTPSFAVRIDWGDNKEDLVSRANNIAFETSHTYARAGSYVITVRASDSKGRVAFLQVVIIVNGKAESLGGTAAGTTTPNSAWKNGLLLTWPLYVIALAMVISFWLGEKREKKKLEKQTAGSTKLFRT